MNKFQKHLKSLPESGASFQQAPQHMPHTVVTHHNGVTRGVTRMSYPQIQQIPRSASERLDQLKGKNIRRIDINLAGPVFIQSHS